MDLYNSFNNWTAKGKKVMMDKKEFCECSSDTKAAFIAERLNNAAKSEAFIYDISKCGAIKNESKYINISKCRVWVKEIKDIFNKHSNFKG